MEHDIDRRSFLKTAPAAASLLAAGLHIETTAQQPSSYPEIGGQAYTPSDYPIRAKRFAEVTMTDAFWKPKLDVNASVTIPFEAHRSNERGASWSEGAGGLSGNVLEAAIYSLQTHPDSTLQGEVEGRIQALAKTTEERQRLGNEFFEVAAAWYNSTGQRTLLDPAIRTAAALYQNFKVKHPPFSGGERDAINCLQLYRVTRDKSHLDLAKHYLDIRGLESSVNRSRHNQSYKPVLEQSDAVGHAVNCVTLMLSLLDVGMLTGLHAYADAAQRMWTDAATRKMYVTGGVGSTGNEGFGEPYVLPNASAYSETCAVLMFMTLNHRLFLSTGDSKYIDVMERGMYNNALSGVSSAGNRFFYVNRLASAGDGRDARWERASLECCPPNLVRFLASMPGYIYAQDKQDAIYVNLYASSRASFTVGGKNIELAVESDMPWGGKSTIDVSTPNAVRGNIKLRVPGWARNRPVPGTLYAYANSSSAAITLAVNGKRTAATVDRLGYITLDRVWKSGDRIEIAFPIETRWVVADNRVKGDRGRMAVERGPIVYCAEWPDCEGGDVLDLLFDPRVTLTPTGDTNLGGETVLETSARSLKTQNAPAKPIRLIPYHLWANRGVGKMSVWLSMRDLTVGDVGPAGGLVFYVNPNATSDGWRYLEAAPFDQSAGAKWGCFRRLIAGARGAGIGAGKQNTADIAAACTDATSAAALAASANINGFTDWFLPSRDELALMYKNLKATGASDFGIRGPVDNVSYWTSTQQTADMANHIDFADLGRQHYDDKDFPRRVRAARAFALAIAAASALVAGAPTRAHAQGINPAYFADLHWRSIGPPRSGYITSPAGIPGDPTTYYVGTPAGGVWKTTNAGTTWTPIFDAMHVASIGAVAVAPSDPTTVYVGTGNASGWSFTSGNGVYKSSDAGKTWTNVGLHTSQYIGQVIVSPKDANVVLVAAQGGRGGGPGRGAQPSGPSDAERGVYRTADGGRTWARVLPTDGSAGATDLYYDFFDPQIIYASLGAGAGTGVYKSIDGGVTWSPVGGRGLPEGARINSFAVSSGTHGRRLYAVASVGGGRGGGGGRALYRSEDGGETWVFGTRQLASAGGKIYADPKNPDVMYLMGTSIYRSTDGGRRVTSFWGAPSGADPRFLWIDPTNPKRMLAGVDQGAAITVDGGETFTPYYGLVNGQFYRVATDYDFPYHVCGPQQDSGTACVSSHSDFGEIRPNDWYPAGGFENGFLIADPGDKRYMYTQGWYHVLRRFDRTTGQVTVLYQPTNTDRFGGAPPLAFSPQTPHTLYMGAQYVLMSPDNGEHWRAISPDLAAAPGTAATEAIGGSGNPARASPAATGSISSLALSPVQAGVMWAGTSTRLIHVTRDGGKTWKNVTPPNVPGSINVIDASHASAGTAYVAVLSQDGHPHLYRTTNFGGEWKEITSGIADDGTMRVIREDPADPNLVYAGSVTSAYVSFDKGDHWQSLQLNLPTTIVSDMTVKGSDLVISTYGRGFWILDDVAPLRQVRAALAANTSAHFFRPDTVVRARWDNTQDTPLPPELVVGDNPPEGAIFDYYLSSAATGPMTMTISDATGHVVRELSSVAPPRDTVMPNVPEYWLASPTVLPTSAGMHRVNWDLRYADPPTLNYGYNGNLLDYREYTLNWHATPGHTYRSTIVGTMVLPGTYSVKLTVDGRTYTQPLVIVPDPRVRVPMTALVAQYKLQQRMVAGLTASYHGFNYVQQLRDTLAAVIGRSSSTAELVSAAKALDAALAPIQMSGFGIVHRDLGRRYSDQFIGDAMPTPSIVVGVDEPCKQLESTVAALRKLESTSVVDLNRMLGRVALPASKADLLTTCTLR